MKKQKSKFSKLFKLILQLINTIVELAIIILYMTIFVYVMIKEINDKIVDNNIYYWLIIGTIVICTIVLKDNSKKKKKISYLEYLEAEKTVEYLIDKINDDTLKDSHEYKVFNKATKIVEKYEKKHFPI